MLPLNTDYKAEEIEYFLTDSDSSLFFTDRQRFSQAEEKLKKLTGLKIVLVDSAEGGEALSLDRELEKTPRGYMRQYPTGADDVAVICYTSGTTGRSKGAMITHKNLISNMTALHEIWGWTRPGRAPPCASFISCAWPFCRASWRPLRGSDYNNARKVRSRQDMGNH